METSDHGLCPSCNPDIAQMRRLSAWKTAYKVLTAEEHDWGEEYGKPCPADVLHLALYLDGAADG